MNRKEANKIIEKHSAAFGALPREAIEAIEYLINAEPCEESAREWCKQNGYVMMPEGVYEQDITKAYFEGQNIEPCEDTINRQAVFEQINCWIGSGEYRYTNATDYLTKRISKLPPVTPKQTDALDKIRAEIKEQYGGCGLINDGLDMALSIIDKYKAERGEKE